MAKITADTQYHGHANGFRYAKDRMNKGVTIHVPADTDATPQQIAGAARQIMGVKVRLDGKRPYNDSPFGTEMVAHRYTRND